MINTDSKNTHTHQATGREFRFCPKCGGQLQSQVIEQRMRQVCSTCNFIFFHDPKPVAVALVQREREILLIQRGNEPKHGFWSFPTGFIDIGDTPAETAIRETKEEADVQIELDRLLGVYSDMQRAVVLIVYVGTIVSGVPIGSAEALAARLFDPKSLPELAFDHDYRILQDFFDTTEKR